MVCKQSPGQASCDARGLLQSLAWHRLKNSLKVAAPFFPKDSERCFSCNGCHNTALVGRRRKVICRSFSLYKRGKTSLAFIFHKGLHDFKAASHKRLKKEMGRNSSCSNCLFFFSNYRVKTAAMKREQLYLSFQPWRQARGKNEACNIDTCRGAIRAEECREH